MRKFSFLLGFGMGYVLGAKAGTQRYEQLQRLYENLSSSPTFKQATGKAKEAAASGFESARGAASESVGKVKEAVKERREDRPTGLTVAPPPQ